MHYNARHLSYDVTMWDMSEKPDEPNPVYLDRDRFSRHHQVQVTIDNPQLKKWIERENLTRQNRKK